MSEKVDPSPNSQVFATGAGKLPTPVMRAISPSRMDWAHESAASLSNSLIMMVDDEELNIEMTQAFLTEAGYQNFQSTVDPTKAISMMRARTPRVLLLDLSMPQVNGLDILEQMRDDAALRHIPVIVLTGTTDSKVRLKSLAVGAIDFLSKPVDPSELALRIRNTLAATAYREHLAKHDPLTGLPNTHCYREDAIEAIRIAGVEKHSGAVIHIGVDRLDAINEAMGRSFGDQIVQRLSKRLASCVEIEATDQIDRGRARPGLYRFDGDEFTVLLPHMDDIETVANFISELLEASAFSFSRSSGQEVFVTCSIGVAEFPGDGREADVLMSNASAAMRHAKESGRHAYAFYSPALVESAVKRVSLGADLRRAFVRNEVELLYQPRIRVADGKLVGAECVARWTHPSGQVHQGDDLLELAATSDLSMALTEWVFDQLLTHNKRWRALEFGLVPMGVNVSFKQLSVAASMDIVRKAIKSGLHPKYLCLELHEASVLDSKQVDVDSFMKLQQMGVTLALDHFGAGHSSLIQLRRLPIQEVKVDAQFFRHGEGSKPHADVVKGLLALTRSLGLTFVATGIDTVAQLAFVKALGCEQCQGRLFNVALTEAEFAKSWLRVGS